MFVNTSISTYTFACFIIFSKSHKLFFVVDFVMKYFGREGGRKGLQQSPFDQFCVLDRIEGIAHVCGCNDQNIFSS
jgi:hypothetical protein